MPNILLKVAVFAWCFLGVAGPGPDVRANELKPVTRADDFVNSIGVVSHFDYWGSSYATAWPRISAALASSGIKHIRDGGADKSPLYLSRLSYLADRGINHSAIFNVTVTPSEIVDVMHAFASHVDFVEPQNEYNASNDRSWANRLVAEQKTLYDTIRGNPAFSSVTVLGPALNFASYYAALGPLDDLEDAGNLHSYPCNLNPGTNKLHFGIRVNETLLRASTERKPIWTTETGYGDDMTLRPQCGLPDEVIAKYVPRMVAERWLVGEPRLYFYQLADMPTDPRFGMLGLLHSDGSSKPQFEALKSLVRVLADPGPKFPLIPQGFDVTPRSPALHSLILQKRNGSYDLLLWLEVESADPRTSAPIEIAPQTVEVDVPEAFKNVNTFTYSADWSFKRAPIAAKNGKATVAVDDKISIVEFDR